MLMSSSLLAPFKLRIPHYHFFFFFLFSPYKVLSFPGYLRNTYRNIRLTMLNHSIRCQNQISFYLNCLPCVLLTPSYMLYFTSRRIDIRCDGVYKMESSCLSTLVTAILIYLFISHLLYSF